MSWSEKISIRIAKKLTPADAEFTVGQVSHGIELFMYNVGYTLILLMLSYFLGCLQESVLILAIFIITRTITGGLHLKSPLACFVTGTLLILCAASVVNVLAGFDSLFSSIVVLLCSLVSLYVNGRFAPAQHIFGKYDEKINKKSRKIIMFFLFFGCILSEFMVYSGYSKLAYCYSIAVLLQSALLHPTIIQSVTRFENLILKEG